MPDKHHLQRFVRAMVAGFTCSTLVNFAPATASANHDGIVSLTSAAAGTVNPANWTFFMETMGNDATWNSPIGQNVETGFAHYAFAYQITQLDVDVSTFVGTVTLDKDQLVGLGLVMAADLAGGDTLPGPLPITIADQAFDEPGVLAANVFVGVDANGRGSASLTNVVLGTVPLFGPIEAVRIGGDVTVAGIPEPAMLPLIAIVDLMWYRRGDRWQ